MIVAFSTFLTPAAPAVADDVPSLPACEPFDCAATHIGVPATSLRAQAVHETRRIGGVGLQGAIDQLDDAMTAKLSATTPPPQGALVESYMLIITEHHAIRDALFNQTFTTLGSTPPARASGRDRHAVSR